MKQLIAAFLVPLLFAITLSAGGCAGQVRPPLLTLYTTTEVKVAALDLEGDEPVAREVATLAYGPSYSRDGTRFTIVSRDLVSNSSLLVMGRLGSKKRVNIASKPPLPKDKDYLFAPSFDPSARRLAFRFVDASGPGVYVADLAGEKTTRILVDRIGVVKTLWDESGLFLLTSSGEIHHYRLPRLDDAGVPVSAGKLDRLGPGREMSLFRGGVLALAARPGGSGERFDIVRYRPGVETEVFARNVGPLLDTTPGGRVAYLAPDPVDPGRDTLWIAEDGEAASARPLPFAPRGAKLEPEGRRALLFLYEKGVASYVVIDAASGRTEARIELPGQWDAERAASFLELGPMDW